MLRSEDIEEAMDPNNASRFMIAPKTTTNGMHANRGSTAITCGCLSGFVGYLNNFLAAVTANMFNPLFKARYSNHNA